MKHDSRLSGVLHVLLHMAESKSPATSETLARAMRTNPVVVRRIMAGLRERGFVRSGKGHGGGWTLERALADITLRDVLEAIGSPSLLAIGHRNEAPECLIEQSVNAALETARLEAEALLLARFDEVTLQALHDDFRSRLALHASGDGKADDVCG
jgi:DNA-binding IscR family transcriptional regulator